MKILFDHQIFSQQKYGGVSRYFTQIITNLPSDHNAEISIKYSDNEYLKQINIAKHLEKTYNSFDNFLPDINFRGKRFLFNQVKKINKGKYLDYTTVNRNLSIAFLKNQDFDVFHPTYYEDYFLPYLGAKPFVLTIHDMIHEIYPELINDFETVKRKANLAAKASHIIAVSENTKKDIIEILGIPEDKITVIYHASSLNYRDQINDLPKNYLLYVGGRGIYKNFQILVRAVEPFLKNDISLKVICIGKEFSQNELYLFQLLGLKDRFVNLQAEESVLFQFYKNANAFIFPSYYEGFGIPILEAFQAECPVILSNSSCFQEIAESAALYFEPKNILQLRNTIECVLNDTEKRKTLVSKGNIRFKDFSWQDSAAKTLNVYKSIV